VPVSGISFESAKYPESFLQRGFTKAPVRRVSLRWHCGRMKKAGRFPQRQKGNQAISERQELLKNETRGFLSPCHDKFGFF
jgi:hypothetical protein